MLIFRRIDFYFPNSRLIIGLWWPEVIKLLGWLIKQLELDGNSHEGTKGWERCRRNFWCIHKLTIEDMLHQDLHSRPAQRHTRCPDLILPLDICVIAEKAHINNKRYTSAPMLPFWHSITEYWAISSIVDGKNKLPHSLLNSSNSKAHRNSHIRMCSHLRAYHYKRIYKPTFRRNGGMLASTPRGLAHLDLAALFLEHTSNAQKRSDFNSPVLPNQSYQSKLQFNQWTKQTLTVLLVAAQSCKQIAWVDPLLLWIQKAKASCERPSPGFTKVIWIMKPMC